MSRETEFLDRHKEDLRIGAELCRLLQTNAREASPREQRYLRLMQICKRLENTCRQMAHERGDDYTWLQLGNHYFKVGEMVRNLRRGKKWLSFGALAEVFDAGVPKIDRLAHTANGVTSLNSSSLLILPEYLRPKPAGGLLLQ